MLGAGLSSIDFDWTLPAALLMFLDDIVLLRLCPKLLGQYGGDAKGKKLLGFHHLVEARVIVAAFFIS